MQVGELLNRLQGLKRTNSGWMAKCPAHDDKKQSLSISVGQDNRILLNCHAGCTTEAIMGRLGLSMRDLFAEPMDRPQRKQLVATYKYSNGAEKLRYSDKSFTWRQPDGKGGWTYNRQGLPHVLYVAGALSGAALVVEGEKDADNAHNLLGIDAVSGEDGAGQGKWHKEYTEQLRGSVTYIIPDNDDIGKAFAQETAAALYGTAALVSVLDLATIWPEIPSKGDLSDYIAHVGKDKAVEGIAELMRAATPWTPEANDPFLACFKTLDNFEEQEATWLVPGWIPESQITLLAADGGIGKTSLWVNLIAAISSGQRCILDPPEHTRKAQRVAFMTTEDSVRKKLKRKLRLAGANMGNIITPDFLQDKTGLLRGLKFGSDEMARFVRYFKPALCVFDPVQGFVPPNIQMGSRNAMRDCMAPLISLGEETGTTFLVVCHTNKRPKAWGRDRIADSADLWDSARSVIMAGFTGDQGIRYLSNEKNNYAALQETLLFSIDDAGQVIDEGTSWKRDKEYTQDNTAATAAPKREDCKSWIITTLDDAGGSMPAKDLEGAANTAGYSFRTLRRAKDELKQAGEVKYFQTGGASDKVWHVQRVGFVEMPDTETPWDNCNPVNLF